MNAKTQWKRSNTSVFWGEIAPCEHILQIYEDDHSFLDVLTEFVGDGIKKGETVLVIATASHRSSLEDKLKGQGFKVDSLLAGGTYLALDAEEILATFMVNGWPDEELFMEVVGGLIVKASQKNGRVRAFGEMVALLWAQGNNGATVNLEHLWNKLCEIESCSVFCAYPKSGFTRDAADSMMHICGSHSRMISGKDDSEGEIFYQNIGSSM